MTNRLILALSLTTALAGAAQASEPIKIGLSGSFTGGSASVGVSMRDGAELAVKEINESGGIRGQRIKLIERDDQARNELGVQIAQELINKEEVVAVAGFVNTGVAQASQRFYQDAEIPVMTNVACGTVLTHQFPDAQHNYVFRVAASDLIQSAMISDEAIKRRGFKKPAILNDSTNYGMLGRSELEHALAKLGVQPVAEEKFNIGDTDMTDQVLKAKEAGADVILTYGVGPELAQIASAMAKLGWKAPMIGSWTLAMSGFIDAAGKNSDGALMPQTFIEDPSTPKRTAFIKAFHKAFGGTRMPSAVSAAQGYDSMYLLAAALKQAKSADGRKIREALENLQTKVDGVITTYDRPYSARDHEALSGNIPVMGLVKDGVVIAAHPQDLIGDSAVRLKPKA